MEERTTNVIELKKVMVERGLSKICDLSSASKVNRTTLGNIVNGKSQPSAAVIRRLVGALDMSPDTAGRIFFARRLLNK